ncbi:uncharacterized protein TA11545 [Theileria annulata]|uniref:Uncharacterized protein n=1 Tax=Theileria annulata TaxID=5874 RepID=Q4UDJ6_THEAN|nr:uncharacterized protein TA11545 [Theileria annulata]CAI74843.1 hypothetical protein TA11545 [Theileria annulata]|eukprot:XP_952575.1 hypothetical protein TA11545 [Theileria annulata]
MKPSVDLILQSLGELSKRKIKRYANVWSTKISDLYLVRSKITKNHVPFISKCFLINNLLNNQDVKNILRYVLPQIIDKNGFSVEEYSLMSYVYSCIDEDDPSETILVNNYSKDSVETASDEELLTFLNTISLMLSRRIFGKINFGFRGVQDISNDLMEYLWDRVNAVSSKCISEMVEYLKVSEIMLESIFISNLLGKLDKEVLNNNIIDHGSIFSFVKISQLLSPERKSYVMDKIYSSDYNTILDTLRKINYFKLPNMEFTEHLFNRLCNTPAKSTMCRKEALGYLDNTIFDLEGKIRRKSVDSDVFSRLHSHLKAIKSTNVLENPHRSRVRWNFPCFIA